MSTLVIMVDKYKDGTFRDECLPLIRGYNSKQQFAKFYRLHKKVI